MTESQFQRKLAEIILSYVDNMYRGFRHDVQSVGHFNGNVFMPKCMFHHVASTFFLIALTSHRDNLPFEMFRFFVGGITGMWLVFTCFRLSGSWLEKLRLSRPLQYVGTRTLDIYLLHYFFLPRFLQPYADWLKAFDSQFVEFWVILAIALIVLGLTLLASYLIRLSPFLGHYLFGVKYER